LPPRWLRPCSQGSQSGLSEQSIGFQQLACFHTKIGGIQTHEKKEEHDQVGSSDPGSYLQVEHWLSANIDKFPYEIGLLEESKLMGKKVHHQAGFRDSRSYLQ